MAYTKTTNFLAKDSLLSGDPAKLVKGSEIDTEFTAIQTADALNVKRDGSATIAANIPMNTFKLTGLAAGTTAGDSVRYEQFASPPAIGGTAAAAITGTTITASTQFTGPGTGLTGTAASLTAGAATTTTTATTATNIAGGSAGTIPYQTAAGTTSMITAGTSNQLLKGGTTPAWALAMTLGTEQATTSGTSFSYTGLPTGIKRLTIMFDQVSTSGANDILIQLGTSGGIETSGYVGASVFAPNGAANVGVTQTTGFVVYIDSAANIITGQVTIDMMNATYKWCAGGSLVYTNAAASGAMAGTKTLAGILDRLTITTVGGVDTFDLGAINISYE